MKKSYPVENGDLIALALGTQSTVTFMKRSGKFHRRLRISRINKIFYEVVFQDFDGSRFEFVINVELDLASLRVPSMDGSAEEWIFLDKLWSTTLDFLNC